MTYHFSGLGQGTEDAPFGWDKGCVPKTTPTDPTELDWINKIQVAEAQLASAEMGCPGIYSPYHNTCIEAQRQSYLPGINKLKSDFTAFCATKLFVPPPGPPKYTPPPRVYTDRGCSRGEPPADERPLIDAMLNAEELRRAAEAKCSIYTGQAYGGCMMGAATLASQLKNATAAMNAFCAEKAAAASRLASQIEASKAPAHPPPSCTPLPPYELPNLSVKLTTRGYGYTCPAGVPMTQQQAELAQKVLNLQIAMEDRAGRGCGQTWSQKMVALRARKTPCPTMAEQKVLQGRWGDCIMAAEKEYGPQIATARAQLDSACAYTPPVLIDEGTPSEILVEPPPEYDEEPPSEYDEEPPPEYDEEPPPETQKSNMLVGGILLLLLVAGGVAVWRSTRKKKAA